MPPDPDPARIRPGKTEFGLLRRSAAAGARLRRAPPPNARPNPQSHPIQIQRARLDRAPFRSEPLDLDPTAEICAYPFGLYFLLKSPCTFWESTRGPNLYKRISSYTQVLTFRPLNLFKIEPADLMRSFSHQPSDLSRFYVLVLGFA